MPEGIRALPADHPNSFENSMRRIFSNGVKKES